MSFSVFVFLFCLFIKEKQTFSGKEILFFPYRFWLKNDMCGKGKCYSFLIFTCLTFMSLDCFVCVKKLWVKCIYIFWQGKIISVFFWWRTFENVRFFLFGIQWRCVAILQVFLIFFSIADAMWKSGWLQTLKAGIRT